MKICLKTLARQSNSQTAVLHVQERKPERAGAPCELTCVYKVENCSDYYLLTLEVSGMVEITCQRCLGAFHHDYLNQSNLAVCKDDDVAESLSARFECIVENHDKIDLMDIVSDELHLFLPERHLDIAGCDPETSRLIGDII